MAAASSLVAREGGDGGGNDPTGGLPPGELEDLEVVLDDGRGTRGRERRRRREWATRGGDRLSAGEEENAVK
jgi:hypothetical protein